MKTNKQSYFSSDYHFDHENVIRFDKRPFKTIDEMNEAIIANHNAIVTSEDDFYFLGDFSFNPQKAEERMSRINGNKFFIRGNHDKDKMIKLYEKHGTYLGELKEVVINGQRITLCHYAMKVFNQSHRKAWHLYGHSHLSLPDDETSLSFDIGIMGNDYKPYSFDDVQRRMNKKKWEPKDHHGTREEDKILESRILSTEVRDKY